MSDEMIKALAAHGGVIMVNFGSSFVEENAYKFSKTRSDEYKEYLAEENLEDTDALSDAFRLRYADAHGTFPFADIENVLDHFEHITQLVGIDHVGIGSDYDGVGDSLPTGLKDVSTYPTLVHGLLIRGFSEQDIRKILGGNLLRVWRHVEASGDAAGH